MWLDRYGRRHRDDRQPGLPTSLSYAAGSDAYTYVWKTNKIWSGSCHQLVVKLADGSYHYANFTFTK